MLAPGVVESKQRERGLGCVSFPSIMLLCAYVQVRARLSKKDVVVVVVVEESCFFERRERRKPLDWRFLAFGGLGSLGLVGIFGGNGREGAGEGDTGGKRGEDSHCKAPPHTYIFLGLEFRGEQRSQLVEELRDVLSSL